MSSEPDASDLQGEWFGAAPGQQAPQKPAPPAAPPGRGQGAEKNGLAAGSMSMAGTDAAPISEPPESLLKQIAPGRRGLHPAAYALIAASAVFGGVSAVLLLSRPPPQAPPTIVVQVPALPPTVNVGAPNIPAPPGMNPGEAAQPGSPAGAPKPGASVAPISPTGLPAGAKTASPTGSANIDTSGFGQPTGAPPGPEGPGAGVTTQLSAGEINGVVAQNQALIRRKCWQPALDSRAGGGPSARVTAKILIGPSGNVETASASGAESDYPGLSSCIASRVQGWKFPASSSSTPVNIPFVFAAQ
jgi:hypothetical protein